MIKGGNLTRILAIIDAGNALLLSDLALFNEISNVSLRPKMQRYELAAKHFPLMIRIREVGVKINTTIIVTLCRDPKNNYLLALAKDGRATHLITGDKDLLELPLNPFEGTRLLTMGDYLVEGTG